VFSLWDTYRAEQPLITLLHPERVNDMVQSLITEYQENGQHTVPIWPLYGNETWCMIGYHSAAVIADAYLKGFRNYDAEAAYRAIRDTAMQDRSGLKTYKQLGYMAAGGGRQATSHTIEYAFDDWCIAKMAETLGHPEDAKLFYQRSTNYRNIFDRTSGFFRGRKANGFWRQPFIANGLVNDEYTEGDAWQYAFGDQQDVPSLIALYGGNAGLVQKLDELFTTNSALIEDNPDPDITGLIGQYAHGNEPCHHIAYLYDYVGASYKTQQRVRQIMATFYDESPTGQCGNTDCGQMAAWYVFSALGFYPVNPDSDVYVIGSPLGTKAVIHLSNKWQKERTFSVIADNNDPQNIYIQSATLNGKSYSRPWLTYQQILAGGVLHLVMGPQPNLNWGNDPADQPPTTMPADFHYAALPTPAAETGPEVKTTASNVYFKQYADYGPENAFDGDDETRWATDTTPAWIAVDMLKPQTVSGVRIDETYHRVQQFEFQYMDGNQWKTIFAGTTIGTQFEKRFAPVTAQEFRLNVMAASENASINEIELLHK
jgi:predicted alpha-1,2-mannosidase